MGLPLQGKSFEPHKFIEDEKQICSYHGKNAPKSHYNIAEWTQYKSHI